MSISLWNEMFSHECQAQIETFSTESLKCRTELKTLYEPMLPTKTRSLSVTVYTETYQLNHSLLDITTREEIVYSEAANELQRAADHFMLTMASAFATLHQAK